MFEWKLFIHTLDSGSELFHDMKKLNIKEIELEIRFKENYPFSPPFVRVVSPRFQLLSAHVSCKGAICNELLTEKGWSPACNIESLITVIISEIYEGKGRLDYRLCKIPYNYEEAVQSFHQLVKSHGWN
jgi:ubiquitin-conjugating enzyme E2 Q